MTESHSQPQSRSQSHHPAITSTSTSTRPRAGLLLLFLHTTAAEWLTTLALIFGGCCSNAWALEQATSQIPHAGSLITFAQFLLVALYGLWKHLALAPPPAPAPPLPLPSAQMDAQLRATAADVLALHAGICGGETVPAHAKANADANPNANVCVAVEGAPKARRAFADELARELARAAPAVQVARVAGAQMPEGAAFLAGPRAGGRAVVLVEGERLAATGWDYRVVLASTSTSTAARVACGAGVGPAASVRVVEYPAGAAHRRPLGLLKTAGRLRLKERSIPLSRWATQVALFFLTSLLNNAAFGYRVPMRVHIIFRSGGLVVNMVMGTVIDGRRYNMTQVISVVVVTLGVICTTLSASQPSAKEVSTSGSYFTGILVLTVALVMSGFMGIEQDRAYAKYGRGHWQEAMFYLHFLALPGFAFVWRDLIGQLRVVNASARVEAWNGRLSIPSFYFPLLLNIVTQLLCVSGVHRLTSRVNSLTVTLVLVVRKAVSLGISVWGGGRGGGGNLFWLGAVLVFAGTVGYGGGWSDKVKKE